MITKLYLILFTIFFYLLMFYISFNFLSSRKKQLNKIIIKKNNKMFTLIYLVLFILVSLITNLIYAIIFSIIILYFSYLYKNNKKKKHAILINNQLLETIRIFKNIILSGQSIVQAIDEVSNQIKDPISTQFKEIYSKVKLGISLDIALEESSKKVNSQQYKLFLDSIRISNSTGAKLSDILNKIEESISQRMSIYSNVQALTAQGKLSGLIVSIVPFFIIIFVYFAQPDMMSLLFTTLIGNFVLLVSTIMILLGSFLMSKISEVDI